MVFLSIHLTKGEYLFTFKKYICIAHFIKVVLAVLLFGFNKGILSILDMNILLLLFLIFSSLNYMELLVILIILSFERVVSNFILAFGIGKNCKFCKNPIFDSIDKNYFYLSSFIELLILIILCLVKKESHKNKTEKNQIELVDKKDEENI